MWSSQAPSASSPPAPTLLIVPPIAHLHRLPTTYLPCRPRLRLSSRLRGPPPRLPGLRSIEVGTKPPSLPPIAPWYWLHPHLTGSSISVPPTTPPPSQACYLAPTHLIPPPPPHIDRRWKWFHSAGHLSRCIGSPWTVLSKRCSRSPSYHPQSPFRPSVHRQFLFH
jgi:hypothetical protein